MSALVSLVSEIEINDEEYEIHGEEDIIRTEVGISEAYYKESVEDTNAAEQVEEGTREFKPGEMAEIHSAINNDTSPMSMEEMINDFNFED